MAGGADFLVDLEAAAQGLGVEGFGEFGVFPGVLGWVEAVVEVCVLAIGAVLKQASKPCVVVVTYPSSAGDMACVGRPNW